MKKLIQSVLFLLLAGVSHAQYYYVPNINANQNPGNLNSDAEYPLGGGLPAGWSQILGPTNASPTWSAVQNMPFSFSLNGSPVTKFKVSSSGVLTFDVNSAVSAPSYTRAALPSASVPDSSVCLWGLSALGTNDNIVTKVFGTAPNRQLWVFFTSYGYGSTPSDGSNFTYWSIVMEETTNNIHLMDQRNGGFAGTNKLSMGVQLNSTTAYSVNGSPDVTALAGADPSAADNSYYTFIQGVQPSFDLAMNAITTSSYIGQGNRSITGEIKNLGSTAITSFTLNYKVDNGATISSNITGVNIATYGTYSFTHPTMWNATTGNHTVEVWATNLNGSNTDENTANDLSSKSISVLGEIVQRLPFFEIFSSSTCGPCAPGNANFIAITDTIPRENFVAVKYQQDFPGTGDPYRTVETVNRRNTPYAINSIPRMEIDGGWDGNASSFTYGLYEESRELPAFFKLSGEYARNAKEFKIKVKYSPLVSVNGAKVYVAIIETKTKLNKKSNGETEFHDIVKKFVPSETGTAVSNVAVGSFDSLSLTYVFNGNYRLPSSGQAAAIINHSTEHSVENFYHTEVISWIQLPNKDVMQAARLKATENTGSVSELTNTISEVSVSPNPANAAFNISFDAKNSGEVTYVLVDVMGSVVFSGSINTNSGINQFEIPTANQASGMYHLMMFDANNNSHVEKVMIQH